MKFRLLKRMKITKLIYILFFGFLLSCTLQAQNTYNETVLKDGVYTFSLEIIGSTFIVIDPPESGEVSSSNVGKVYTITYTPDAGFIGFDEFTFQDSDIFSGFSENHQFLMNVVESMVELDDDFIRLTSDQSVTIDPTANDESTASMLTLEIAQVMFGTAEVNDDNTITYTPSEGHELDYIVYSGKDMYGVGATATIYISTEGEEPTSNTSDEFDMPSGSHHYITLPWVDYSHDGGEVEFGELTQVNDYVWKYISDESAEGLDELIFTNESGLEHAVSANVIEKYIDDGFVKDDIFFTAKNTQIIFNVQENDLNGQTVIVSYSEELTNLGDGEFAYTPEPGTSGVYEFSYEADSGSEVEEGSIKIVVGNFTPSASADYTLTAIKNQPRVIEYEVPLGTEFFEIESYPSHGTIEVFGLDESVDVGCEEGLQKVFALYTPNQDFVGADDVTLRYFASDNNLPSFSTIVIVTEDTDEEDACICVDNCVWPGDANGDGNVNVRDLLSIGRNMGSTGEPRDDSPFGESFEGAQVTEWTGNQVNGKSIGFADANGDGIVSTEDIASVTNNYNSVNTLVSNDLFGVKNIPFYMISDSDVEVGDVKIIYIYAGTSSSPAIDMSGIAFSVNLPENNVDVSSIDMEYTEDNFFVKGAPYAELTHVSDDAIVETAGVKTNKIGSTGFGLIGVLTFIVVDDAEGIRPEGRNSVSSNGKMIVEMNNIVFEAADGLQYSLPSSSLEFDIKDTADSDVESINVYPNPANDIIQVESDNGSVLSDIKIISITGESIANYSNINQKSTTLDISNLDAGMYILNATNEQGTKSIKLIKG
ncbi:MAG: hypothetical protein ACJA1A_001943 [Saprospiraceae bacterium]|jgi:hypothetical protein